MRISGEEARRALWVVLSASGRGLVSHQSHRYFTTCQQWHPLKWIIEHDKVGDTGTLLGGVHSVAVRGVSLSGHCWDILGFPRPPTSLSEATQYYCVRRCLAVVSLEKCVAYLLNPSPASLGMV